MNILYMLIVDDFTCFSREKMVNKIPESHFTF